MDPYAIHDNDDWENVVPLSDTDDADLYGILNVEHKVPPDKFQDVDSKALASEKFQLIQQAYDVLSDANRRYIYDLYGLDAITQSWDVGLKAKSKEELRDEVERKSRVKRQMDVQNLVKSKGEIVLGLDASAAFSNYPESRGLMDLLVPEFSHALVVHSWETNLAPQTDLTIQGQVSVRNGMGGGNVIGTVRHVINPSLLGEASIVVGEQPSTQLKLTRTFGTGLSGSITLASNTLSVPPTLGLTATRQLSKSSTGYMTYRPGMFALGPWGAHVTGPRNQSLAIGYVVNWNKMDWNVELNAGTRQSHITLTNLQSLPLSFRLRNTISLSTSNGISASIGGEKILDKTTQVGVSVKVGQTSGITFQLKLIRLGQKFTLPILLSPEPDLKLLVGAIATPLVIGIALDYFVLKGWRKRARETYLGDLRESRAESLKLKKKQAEEAIQLMKESVLRKYEAEEEKGGLVIREALYGKLPDSKLIPVRALSTKGLHKMASNVASTLTGKSPATNLQEIAEGDQIEDYIDVTVVIQNMVQNSQLYVSGGYSKTSILGFWDCCLGEPKRLRITYLFQKRLHVIEVDDLDAVAAPLRGTLL